MSSVMRRDAGRTEAGPWLRLLPESRPPVTSWLAPVVTAAAPGQPTLDLEPAPPEVDAPQPSDRDVRVLTVRARWTKRPRRDLPDPESWCPSLALAIVEALHARRPIAQLNRWLADDVLAEVSLLRRRRRAAGSGLAAVPAVLRSVRIQHPHPEVAEVAAHVALGPRSMALAFRLEAWHDRWLCTALELGPRRAPSTPGHGENSSSNPAQV